MTRRLKIPIAAGLSALLLAGCAAEEEEVTPTWLYENQLYPAVVDSDIRFTVSGGNDDNPIGIDFENLQLMTRPGAVDPWTIYDEDGIQDVTREAMGIYLDLRTDPRLYSSEDPAAAFHELLTKDYPDTRSGEFFSKMTDIRTMPGPRDMEIEQIPLPNFDEQYGVLAGVDLAKPQEIAFSEPVITGYTADGGLSTLHAEFRETVTFHMNDGGTREFGSMVGLTYTGDPFTEHRTDSETAIYNIIFVEDPDPGQEDYDYDEESRYFARWFG